MISEFLKNIKKCLTYIDNKKKIIFLCILILLIAITSIFIPYLLSLILTKVISKNYKDVIIIIIILGIIKALNLLFTILNSKLFYSIRKNLVYNIRKKLSKKLFNINIDLFLDSNNKSKFFQRINYDSLQLGESLHYIKDYFIILLSNIFVLLYLIYLEYRLALIYLIFVILIVIIRLYGLKNKIKLINIYYDKQEINNIYIDDALNGFKDIKSLYLDEEFNNILNNQFFDMENVLYKADLKFDILHKLSVVLDWIGSLFVFLIGIFLLKQEIIILDVFISMFMYRKNVFSFVDVFTDFLEKISKFNLISKRVDEIINLEEEKTNDFNKDCLGVIEFNNISFKYDKNYILKDCNYIFKPNNIYVIKGASGTGKTTIINLLTRLYKVTNGSIKIDNIDINEYSNYYLKENISVISQDFYLFDMSIKDNLKIVSDNITFEEIINVCKKVGLHDFILNLPNKYDTVIRDYGGLLSGGERQRLALARALLKNSKILLLDEVTSALDEETEKYIFNLINSLKENHTIIVTSHNDYIINKIDNKIEIKNKKLIEVENDKN